MSSHREAPEISKDPVADNTDTYAFVSPGNDGTVTLITNYVPLEGPAAGPNFYEFGDDVRYDINIDNDGDGEPDVTYRFDFTTEVRNPETFLYNTGPIESLNSPNWNRRQFYTVTRIAGEDESVIGRHLACPPCNVGPRSTPNYGVLAQSAVHTLGAEGMVFAGQRQEGFYVDLGSAFDLLDLRPFSGAHLIKNPPGGAGVNATKDLNVHTIAIKVPIQKLTRDGSRPTDPMEGRAVIGVWGAASRRKVRIRQGEGDDVESGPWTQVSRLGNPLFNEVIVPMGHKDLWNSLPPSEDKRFLNYVSNPEVARLLPVLYPGVFPNLAARGTTNRGDLVAILLTGIPKGVVPGFQNHTGSTYADMLRLNVAIPQAGNNSFGLLGGDAAGFPNGRRVFDDVVTIELRAIAGLTYPLVNPSYTPDGAAAAIYDVTPPPAYPANLYQNNFPYLGVPKDGYNTPAA